MILLAAFLASLGLVDLVRARFAGGTALSVAWAIGVVAFAVLSIGSGQPWWWSPVAAIALGFWMLAARESRAPGRSWADYRAGYWAVGGIALAVVAAFVWGPQLPAPTGFIVDWYRSLPYAALSSIRFTTFALTVGGALFLVETANVIVRLALRGEKSVAEPPPVPADTPAFTELKGGRFIGPLERLFLLALLLSGAFAAVAALVAAKGIIRFPEISKDAVGGSKAEYFLVGSFASWALVLLVVMLVLVGG